ncbi:hypothetical protein, partial [uncultured Alistipes sp.]|uniref:hypothetical protein n=1 Tax=uncultured Alistipes sp. TaxID=538949 RepID=UPI002636E162
QKMYFSFFKIALFVLPIILTDRSARTAMTSPVAFAGSSPGLRRVFAGSSPGLRRVFAGTLTEYGRDTTGPEARYEIPPASGTHRNAFSRRAVAGAETYAYFCTPENHQP